MKPIYPAIHVKIDYIETWLRVLRDDGKWCLIYFKRGFSDEEGLKVALRQMHTDVYWSMIMLKLTAENFNTMNEILKDSVYGIIDENQDSEFDRLDKIQKGLS